jgi:hypothetical protein
MTASKRASPPGAKQSSPKQQRRVEFVEDGDSATQTRVDVPAPREQSPLPDYEEYEDEAAEVKVQKSADTTRLQVLAREAVNRARAYAQAQAQTRARSKEQAQAVTRTQMVARGGREPSRNTRLSSRRQNTPTSSEVDKLFVHSEDTDALYGVPWAKKAGSPDREERAAAKTVAGDNDGTKGKGNEKGKAIEGTQRRSGERAPAPPTPTASINPARRGSGSAARPKGAEKEHVDKRRTDPSTKPILLERRPSQGGKALPIPMERRPSQGGKAPPVRIESRSSREEKSPPVGNPVAVEGDNVATPNIEARQAERIFNEVGLEHGPWGKLLRPCRKVVDWFSRLTDTKFPRSTSSRTARSRSRSPWELVVRVACG